MSEVGLSYTANLSLSNYVAGTLSRELMGPIAATGFSVQSQSETKTRKSLRIGGGGKTEGTFGRTLATKIKFSLNAVSGELLALILQGKISTLSVSGGSAVAESVTVKNGVPIRLNNYNITQGTAAITGSVLDTDFTIDGLTGSITALASGNLVDGATVSLNYDFGAVAGSKITIGTESKTDVRMEGPMVNNEDESNARILIPKVTVSPTNELSFLSQDYVDAELEGECVLMPGEAADHYLFTDVVYS